MDATPPCEPPSQPSAKLLQAATLSSGRDRLTVIGQPLGWLTDAYVRLMGMSWKQLILLFVLSFVSFNLLFAILYSLMPGSLADSSRTGGPPSLIDAFFFSVQTVATIGYGVLFPKSLYANVLVTIEIMAGVMGFAMGNGLMFARFSRPTSRIMFSNVAVITAHNGVPTLMFRAANQRHNLILEAQVRLAMTRVETSTEGRVMRRFRDLAVERRENLTFVLSWTVIHPIDEMSPLFGMTEEEIVKGDFNIIVVMTGTDESFSQPVYARHSYHASDIRWGKEFVDILGVGEKGQLTINYNCFHQVVDAAV